MASAPRIQPPPSNEDEWLGTYGDAITLVLCFFVLIYSVSEPNTEKFEAVSKGIVEGFTRKEISTPFVDIRKQLNTVTMESGQSGEQSSNTPAAQRGQTLPFASDRLFGPGSADILPDAEESLDRIAQLVSINFARTNAKITIEAHTDDAPINSPRFPSNWELSAARAASVARYLISRGVEPKRLAAVGLADTQPLQETVDLRQNLIASQENRAKNRRVVIKIDR